MTKFIITQPNTTSLDGDWEVISKSPLPPAGMTFVPLSEPLTPSKPQPHPFPKEPLGVVSLNSLHNLIISNDSPRPIYVIDLLLTVKYPRAIKSFRVDAEIFAGKLYTFPIKELPYGAVWDIPQLGDTWKDHYEKALSLYRDCGLQLVYFSPSEPEFLQFQDHYRERGLNFMLDDVPGVIDYRVEGSLKNERQKISAEVIAMKSSNCPR